MRWLVWLLLCCWAWGEPQVEVALFEGGEGLGFFQKCAQELGQVDCYGDPRISERLRMRILEGRPPEVTNANLPYEHLIAQGQILALDPWLDRDGWRQSFLPGSLDRFRIHGKTYAVPLPYTVQAVYYNRALFRARGWTQPSNWEEWLHLCQKIRDSGLAPLAFQGRYTYYASPLIQHLYYHLAGASAYREQFELRPGCFDNPAMRDSLERVQQLAKENFQAGSLGMSHTEAQMEFLNGRAAMLVCGSWFKSEMAGKFPPGFELAEFPLPPPQSYRGPAAVQVGAGYFFVMAHSHNPEAGVAYLRYITRPDKARQLVAQQDLPVAVLGANAALSPDLAGLAHMLEHAKVSFGEGMTATHPEMAQVWSDVRFALLHQKATPEQLARQLESEATRLRLGKNPVLFPWRPWLLGAILLGLWWVGKHPRQVQLPGGPLPGRDALLLVGPALLIYGLFFLLPSALALLASLTHWDGLGQPGWAGLSNFTHLLQSSPRFWVALGNNLFLMALIPVLVVGWSLLLSLLLIPDRPWLRALYFFPHLLGIGSVLIWQQLYHPSGPLNRLLVGLGLSGFENFTWLSQDHLYPSLLPLAIWSAGGFQLVLTGAALSQVPEDLLEAAELDGASAWDKFWHVSWPYIRPTVVAGYLLLLISAIKSFESVWLFTNQEPTTEVHVLGTLLMQTAFAELHLGEAAALAVILLLLVMALQRALSRWEEES